HLDHGRGRAAGPRGPAGVPVTPPVARSAAEVEWLEGGITAVPGLLASGLHCGIKPGALRDLALVYSSTPATAAGVFTTNRVVGAPVKVSRERVRAGVV